MLLLAANMKVLLVMLLLLSGCRHTVKVVNLVCGEIFTSYAENTSVGMVQTLRL